MSDNFKAMVAGSEVLKARFAEMSGHVIEQARAKYGVELSPGEVAGMPSVQNSVLGNDDDYLGQWHTDAAALTVIKQAVEKQRLQDALASHEATPEKEALTQKLSAMKPEERLSWARQRGIETPKPAPSVSRTVEEKAAALRENQKLRGGAKIAHARANGLI